MLSMYEVATRRSTRGIKLSVGETRIDAARKGCRGLTHGNSTPPVWWLRHVIARRDANGDRAEETNTAGARPGRVPETKRLVFRFRAPTVRSSAASRIAGCFRSRAIFHTWAA